MLQSSNSYKSVEKRPKYAVAGIFLASVAGITYYVNTKNNSAELTNMQAADAAVEVTTD